MATKAQTAETLYRALDGQSFADGAHLAVRLFETYQRLHAPTIPLGDFGALLRLGLHKGWVIEEPGQPCRVQMPPRR